MSVKSIDFPKREFATKAELFAALKENRDAIVSLKKNCLKQTDGIAVGIHKHSDATKSLAMEDGYVYPVINTTKYMDSHNDVHIDGIWDRTIKDQTGKLYYVADHEMKLTSVIAYPTDVQPLTAVMSFSDLGYKNLAGNTQALIFKVAKDKIRLSAAREVIDEKIDIEHSVRMQYVTLHMCINSEDQSYKEYKANWDMYYPYIANKDRADEEGYFWAVTEARIYKEGSMVLAGSNCVTPLLQKDIDDNEPPASTQEKEAAARTSEIKRKHLI